MSKVEIKKPKYQEHDAIRGIITRLKTGGTSWLSSYSHFEVNEAMLLEHSRGNEKLVREVREFIAERQADEVSVSGFQAIGVFKVSREDLPSGEQIEWIHVVFEHGHGVTLIAGRIGRTDLTFRQFADKAILYSMANMLKNG